MELIQSIDQYILMHMQNLQSPFWDKVMPYVSMLGNEAAIWIAAALALLCTRKYKRSGLVMLVALLTCYILGDQILKPFFGRLRPFEVEPGISLLIPRPGGSSFPSGHTLYSFAAATVLCRADRRMGAAAFILAALISLSRLYLFVHYPTDVLGGLILGILIGYLTSKYFRRPGEKKFTPHTRM